ncbi:MAG: GT4 family glycosyltransferase PelF [Elusimicrobiales bacterium]|nr:GT4 family glycosyltransferase PelF [Elusimicrobiales bacterium]
MANYIKKSNYVDIILICEGTFPYIKGGVSSWIYQIIKNLKNFSFGVVFLGGKEKDYNEIQYELPQNLLHLETHFLFDEVEKNIKKTKIKEIPYLVEKMRKLHYWFREHQDNLSDELKKINFYKEINHEQFLFSKNSFKFIEEEYNKNCPDVPFIDYFWTVRSIHYPIWKIVEIAENLPDFKIIHSPSTGYAGFLSSFVKNNYQKKFILTEHGIYLFERKIDLLVAEWIKEYKTNLFKNPSEKNYLRELWIRFFAAMNKFAYETADIIISLYPGAQKTQILLGANPNKTIIIPNGINIEKYINCRKDFKNIKPVITFIGRIVPIKDVKTFITAIKIASEKIKNIEGWIVGPYEEDTEYFQECMDLVKILDIEKNIKFLGYQDTVKILSQTAILSLTSISEGMPIVVLEAMAAGVPCVVTDVGSCKNLIYGIDENDIKLGKSGEIAPVGNPQILAKEYIDILSDENLWQKYSTTAIKRAELLYDEKIMLSKYNEIYTKFIK